MKHEQLAKEIMHRFGHYSQASLTGAIPSKHLLVQIQQ